MANAGLKGASPAAQKQLEKLQKRREQREQWPAEKQIVRLPASSGAPPAIELEDVDDWLQIVLDHRRLPPNKRNPSSLCVLESLGNSCPATCGPGVEMMRRIYSDPTALKEHRSTLGRRKRGGSRWRGSGNPVGQTVPPNARFEEVLPELEELLEPSSNCAPQPPSLSHSVSAPASSVFFQTEVELEDRKPSKPTSITKTPSLPSLPSIPKSKRDDSKEAAGKPELSEMSTTIELKAGSENFSSLEREPKVPVDKKLQAQRLMKAFHKAVDGRSVLILTDQSEVRKSVMRSLMCAVNEMSICFTCSTVDMWKRLSKDLFHALMVDMSKADLEIESLVKTIRADPQYGTLPIIVLSHRQPELPDLVRQTCSFVVFHPLSASMLREALLWCFNRSALKHQSYYWPQAAPVVLPKRHGNSSKTPNLTVRARQLKQK
ncbi:Uncharacterized protein SCF082_LOCUS44434 [Durusdinium trenchii]|uniref:Response regulatory domain-containing protein n=1 Tax=Durusdinium trenchii TaxID=1381693 RepID=A0ABP0R1V5_9DINO